MKLKILLILLSSIPIFCAFSQTSKSLNFDGANDYISLNGIDLNSKSFTVEYWAKRNVIDEGYVVGQGGTFRRNSKGLHIGFKPDALIKFGFFGNDLDSNVAITDTNWHHYAFTYNAVTNSRAIYIDGNLNISDIAPSDYIGSSSNTFYVGRENFTNKFYFSGDLEEFRLWDDERSASEISAHKNHALNGSEPGLTLYYNFNEGFAGADNSTILNVIDLSPNANNGNLSNFALIGNKSNFTNAEASDSEKGIIGLNQTINSGYGQATNSAFTINYSLGQLLVSEMSNSQIFINQGVNKVLKNEITLSNSQLELSSDIAVYPNPVEKVFHILLKNTDVYKEYQIFNGLGKVVSQGKITNTQTDVSTEILHSGIYYLKLKSNQTSKTLKLIKL